MIGLDAKHGGFGLTGIHLYVRHDARWRLGGSIDGAGNELIAVSTPLLDGARTYRLDVGHRAETHVDLGSGAMRRAHTQRRLAVFCSGATPWCAPSVTACDVFVAGKTYFTFRGELVFEGGAMHVRGDRSRSGATCAQDETVFVPRATDGRQ